MRTLLRSLSLAALAGLISPGQGASAAQAGDCRPGAIEHLRAAAPDGFAVYTAIKDKAFFVNWITCDDVALGLSTAVHESVHYITAESDVFPLMDGGAIRRPHEVSRFFAPALIAKAFKTSDFATTYLRPGQSSSATDFLYLLDELNAYTHDLNAAIDLRSLRPAGEEVDNRDGLAAVMAFVALYVQTAEDSQPATWSGLQRPPVADTLSALWGGAERVMASSCGIPDFGAEDRTFIRQVCQPKVEASLGKILGRAPVCPTACLAPTPDAEQASEAEGEPTSGRMRAPAAHLSAVRLFWKASVGRRAPRLTGPETDQDTRTR